MIFGVESLPAPSAFISAARVETGKTCAESAFEPPVVPEPSAAHPSLAGRAWWDRSTDALAFMASRPAPRPAAATVAG